MPTPPDNQWIPAVGGGDESPPPATGDPGPVAAQPPTLPTRAVPNTAFPLQLVPAEGMVRITGMPTEAGLWPSLPGGVTAVDPLLIFPGLPAQLTAPLDKTFSADTTLSVPVAFYKNLTINSGVTVTGLAGGIIILVEETFTLNGTLTVNGLGATGATGNTANGGGAFSGLDVTKLFVPPQLQFYMPQENTAVGGAGGAWPGTNSVLTDLQVLTLGIEFVLRGARTGANYGPLGGGGGGKGDDASAYVGGIISFYGAPGTSRGHGGSGVGAGGNGGAGAGVTAGNGGAGGGVAIVYCNVLSGSGTITANGANGSNGATNGGGGGAGAGGLVVLAYHSTSADSTTLAANGGTGGTNGGGTGTAGGAGGAGYAHKLQITVS